MSVGDVPGLVAVGGTLWSNISSCNVIHDAIVVGGVNTQPVHIPIV
jgi:hypothetical protein